jgi:HEAT repeat protein
MNETVDDTLLRVRSLRKAGDLDGLLAILDRTEAENIAVQMATIEALGRVGDPRAVQPILTSLQQGRVNRLDAVVALGRIGDAQGEGALLAALDDPNSLVRTKAAEGLGDLRSRKAVRRLTEMLAAEGWIERASAAQALARIGDPASVPHLQEARSREKWPWRRRHFPRHVMAR